MFADDSLLVVEATIQGVQAIESILRNFEECSGQIINTEKSSVMFSANASQTFKNLMMQELHLGTTTHGGKYLGTPTYIGKSKKQYFAYIKDNVAG